MREYQVYIIERRGRWVTVDARDAEEAAERAEDAARDDLDYERRKIPFDWDHIEFENIQDDDIKLG
jgi:hypothetical protein